MVVPIYTYICRLSMAKLDAYKLKVWVDFVKGSHSGYCSDSYDRKETSTSYQFVISIPDSLPDSAISSQGCVDVHMLSYLNKESYHGNGYCGMKSSVCVDKALIVKNPVVKNDSFLAYDMGYYWSESYDRYTWDHADDDPYPDEDEFANDEDGIGSKFLRLRNSDSDDSNSDSSNPDDSNESDSE